MRVNIFGYSPNQLSLKNDNKYVDNKFITLTTNLNTKINNTGDTMTGDLNMGNIKITSTYIPLTESDLINKKYIDSLTTASVDAVMLNSKVNKAGDIMSGSLNMENNKISSTHTPISDEDLINKKHLNAVLALRLNDDDIRIIIIYL